MNAMDSISWSLLFQIPLAGVVVFVVILFLKHLKEISAAFMFAAAEQTDAFTLQQTKQIEVAALAQKEQIDLFMSAIKDQREENIKAISALTTKIDDLGTFISVSLVEIKSARTSK